MAKFHLEFIATSFQLCSQFLIKCQFNICQKESYDDDSNINDDIDDDYADDYLEGEIRISGSNGSVVKESFNVVHHNTRHH